MQITISLRSCHGRSWKTRRCNFGCCCNSPPLILQAPEKLVGACRSRYNSAQRQVCWPHTANQRTRSGHVGGRPHLVLYLHIDAVARMCTMTSSRILTVILRILARPLSDEGSSKTTPATTKTTFLLATDVSRLWISAWENRLRHWSVSLLAMCRLGCCVLLSPSADVL